MTQRHPCPVCRYLTFRVADEIGDICPVCFWEIEGGEDSRTNLSESEGGPNGELSILQAQENFEKYGAVDKDLVEHVRKPTKAEYPIQKF